MQILQDMQIFWLDAQLSDHRMKTFSRNLLINLLITKIFNIIVLNIKRHHFARKD